MIIFAIKEIFMLPEERKTQICDYINSQNAVSSIELMERFSASEATIRRDLTELDKRGLISKVHGGAVSIQNQITTDYNVAEREEKNQAEKIRIAKYAANLIQPNDLIFIDAGTTTSYLIDYVTASNVTFITNAIVHAKKLSALGHRVYLTGGLLKNTTEALVGGDCYHTLERYQFSIGFFGTNAVNHKEGFTTPDPEEARIKECAIAHTLSPYVLCDHTKFDLVASVRFAKYEQACIITGNKLPDAYKNDPTIISLK